MADKPKLKFAPQAGPQSEFLASEADIAIYGGAAFGGKTFALLLEAARHHNNGKFAAIIFRRTTTQIKMQGGLWDESEGLYPLLGAVGTKHNMTWRWPSGMTVKMAHLEHEKTRLEYQGAQIPLICFDELTHFTEQQFFYLMGRCRSASGVPGRIRATCNPDPDSFVAKLVEWWIDADGYAIPERSGKLRWFVRDGDHIVWGDTREELVERYGEDALPKSLTFIAASINDNRIGLRKDPTYLSNLRALPTVDRERLLHGNWKVRPSAGLFFKRADLRIVEIAPGNLRIVRFWDRAATAKTPHNDPDWTVGLALGHDTKAGLFYVLNVVRLQANPYTVEMTIKATATLDGKKVEIVLEEEGGSSGKSEVAYYVRQLAGFAIRGEKATGDKPTRAKAASAQSAAGNLVLVKGHWNEAFILELENFPEGKHDDQVDALSGAMEALTTKGPSFDPASIRVAPPPQSLNRPVFKPRKL